jgi:anti-sigma regulatory factor (Ser/Thr protein kinase)
MEVAVARRFVVDTLARWEAIGDRETVVLLVSELVSNAVVHAQTNFTVTLRYDRRLLTVEVQDGSRRMPARSDVPPAATSGRGLHMVDLLAHDWGVRSLPDGKVTWFTLSFRPPDPSEERESGRLAAGRNPLPAAGEASAEPLRV